MQPNDPQCNEKPLHSALLHSSQCRATQPNATQCNSTHQKSHATPRMLKIVSTSHRVTQSVAPRSIGGPFERMAVGEILNFRTARGPVVFVRPGVRSIMLEHFFLRLQNRSSISTGERGVSERSIIRENQRNLQLEVGGPP